MSNDTSHRQRFDAPGPSHDTPEQAAMPYDPARAGAEASPSRIAEVVDRNAARLMSIDGIVGVAVGRTRIGDDAILLSLRDASVKRRVPAQVEGYPVETTVPGEIDAYGHGRR